MKKVLVLFALLFVGALSAQENLATMSFRTVPQEEMKTFMQNEYIYWSKVAKILKEKEQISYWGINVRSGGGRADDANVMAYIGIGSWDNYENLGKNYAAAEAAVKEMMDPEKLSLIEDDLKQDKFISANFLVNNLKYVWSPGNNWKYQVINYANAKNVWQYMGEEIRLMAPFFEKAMKSGKTNLKGWKATAVVSPQGNDYSFNSMTVDFYENFRDIFTSWSPNTQWPKGIEKLNAMKENGSFWRSSIWQRVMYLDSNNELQTSW